MFQSWWYLVQTCEVGKCCSIPIPSVAPMWVYAGTKFSLGHSQIWLLILCDVQIQFDRPLNFHCCSTLREGHLGIIVEEECGSGEIWGETNVDKLFAGDKDQKIAVFDCHLKKRWSADGPLEHVLQPNCYTWGNVQCTFTIYNMPYNVYLKPHLCDMNDYALHNVLLG